MNSFEKTLSELNRKELPPQWKGELLDRAFAEIAEIAETTVEDCPPIFSPFAKVNLGAIAACWVAIGILLWATPSDPDRNELADRFGISPEQVPLLAARLGAVPDSEISHPY